MEAKSGSPKTLTTRIVSGDYIAEVVVDETAPAAVFHWFVRNRTTFEVLILGETDSRERALKEAEEHLKRLSEGTVGPAGAIHLSASV